MRGHSQIGFGLLCAYVLPGFTLLASLSLVLEPLQVWLLGSARELPAVGGVLYVTAASVLLGQLLNLLRWAFLDWIFSSTGIRRPVWDEQQLSERLQAYEFLVESHFRYFQFYGNMAIALPLSLIAVRLSAHSAWFPTGTLELATIALETTLIFGARDALRRYFSRSVILLGKDASAMTNGSHPKPDDKNKSEKKEAAAAASERKDKDSEKKD